VLAGGLDKKLDSKSGEEEGTKSVSGVNSVDQAV
jgi:hypothetical protein